MWVEKKRRRGDEGAGKKRRQWGPGPEGRKICVLSAEWETVEDKDEEEEEEHDC